MIRILTPLFILALAVPLSAVGEAPAKIEAPKIGPRCQVDKLDALFRESNPAAKEDLKAFVTADNVLRVPEADAKADLGKAPLGSPLCSDAVWRYLLRDERKLRGALLQDQIRTVQAASNVFQQVDELYAKVSSAAGEVYAQAATMDIVSVAQKPITFGFRGVDGVREVAGKEPHPVMDPAEYEAALLKIIQPKDDTDAVVPGAALQAFYKSLLDLRAKLGELKLAKLKDHPGLKEQHKTPEAMHAVMEYVADCDFSRSDAEAGRKLNCWASQKADSDEGLGRLDLLLRNLVGSDLAQSTFIYARAVALVEKVGPDGKKRTIRGLLQEFAKLKDEGRVRQRDMRVIDLNHMVFQNIGKGLFGKDQGIDDLRTAWATKGEEWQKANPKVKEAIDAVDGMQGAQVSGGSVLFKDKDKEVLYGKDIDVLTVKPDEMAQVSSQVADRLLKGDKWGAVFQAARAAVFGEPKKEDPPPAKKEDPKKQPKKQPKKEAPKKEEPKKEEPKKEEPKKEAAAVIPQLPEPKSIGWWEGRNLDPMEKVRLGYERALGDQATADSKARMAQQDQRLKTIGAAIDAKQAAYKAAESNPFLSDEAKTKDKAAADKAYQEALAKSSAEYKAGEARRLEQGGIQKAWTEQANQRLAALYNEKILVTMPALSKGYKRSGWRHRSLDAETQAGGYLGDDLIEEYFQRDWLAKADQDPVKANLLACQKAHGFAPSAGSLAAATPYVNPTEASVEAKCVRAGLVAHINSQKGKRSK